MWATRNLNPYGSMINVVVLKSLFHEVSFHHALKEMNLESLWFYD
jgi:hypothetical protein